MNLAELEAEIRTVIATLRQLTSGEVFVWVLRLEELMNTRASLLLAEPWCLPARSGLSNFLIASDNDALQPLPGIALSASSDILEE